MLPLIEMNTYNPGRASCVPNCFAGMLNSTENECVLCCGADRKGCRELQFHRSHTQLRAPSVEPAHISGPLPHLLIMVSNPTRCYTGFPLIVAIRLHSAGSRA